MPTPLTIALAARATTRDELAKRVGVSGVWIGELAAGRKRPSRALAKRIGEALDVDPDELFAEETAAVVITFVRRTTSNSGVPERVADPVIAGRVADVLRSATP